MNKLIYLIFFIITVNLQATKQESINYLTKEERSWIKEYKVITARVSDFTPLHFMEENISKGISKEYLDYVAKTVGLEVKYVTNIPWSEALEALKKQEKLDLLLTAGYSEKRALFMSFSKPYIKPPLVIFTQDNNHSIQTLEHLSNKTISIEKNYVAYSLIKKEFPNIKLKIYKNTQECLKALSIGKVDAYVGTLLTANHKIKQHGFDNIKIAGPTPFKPTEIAFGLRSDLPYLKSIIDKTILRMDQNKRNEIESKWLSIKYEKTDYLFLTEIVFVLLLIIFVVIMVNKRLKKEILQRKESDKLFKLIFDQAALGVILLDMNKFSYVTANKRFCEMLNMSLEEVLSNDYMQLTHPEDLEKTKHYNKLLRDEIIKEFTIEKRYILKNGEVLWMNVTYKATWEKSSSKRYAIVMVEDISQRKNLEKNKVEKDNLLLEQSKMASLGEMIGNIAHQWRQPLSVISTMATGLQLKHEMKTLKDSELVEIAEGINRSVQHLSETIDDFRSFYKPNNKEDNFSVTRCINKAVALVSAQFVAKDIFIIKNIDEREIFGLENELVQVIINILNNARDALCENKPSLKYIFIDAKIVENEYLIEVYDNAKGIPLEVIKKVFEPYFTTKHQSQGTGIGLYRSEEIISKHMLGRLSVSNKSFIYEGEEHIGASFLIALPIKR